MKRFIQILIFLCFSPLAIAQPTSTDQQLANLYYSNGEFDKAIPYFEKILNKQSVKYDQLRYVECLEKTNKIKDAERAMKKFDAANIEDVDYQILLGDFYSRNNNPAEEEKLFTALIKNNTKIGYQVIDLYNSFLKLGKT